MKRLILVWFSVAILFGCGDAKSPKVLSFYLNPIEGLKINATLDSDAQVTAREYKLSVSGRFKK